MKSCFATQCYLLSAAILVASAAGAQDQKSAPAAQTAPSPQDAGSPLAAAARNGKAQKAAHAKKVFTDDDMEGNAGPLPRIKMEDGENSEEIVAAIAKYKAAHTPEQTEQAVRTWYDRYDEMLVAAIDENHEMQTVGSVNLSNANELCQQSQDYQQCQSRQMAEQRGGRADQNRMTKNFTLLNRIQIVFMKVRSGLFMNFLHYSWFRIQNYSYNGDDL